MKLTNKLRGRLGSTLLELMGAEQGKPVSGMIKVVFLVVLLFSLVVTWGAGIDRVQYYLSLYFVLLL